jgi:bacteriocin biosynthesis cyclodehydratase domain-containing protein
MTIASHGGFGGSFASRFARLITNSDIQVTKREVASCGRDAPSQADALLILAGGTELLSSSPQENWLGSSRVPWMPVLRDGGGKLWIGPVFGPRRNLCVDCYENRRGQHGSSEGPGADAGPVAPAVLAVAAGLAAWMARPALRQEVPPPGRNQVAIFDEVLPVHGCPRCGVSAASRKRETATRLSRLLPDALIRAGSAGSGVA